MKKLFFAFLMLFSVITFAQTSQGSSFVGIRASDLGFSNYNKVTTYGVGVQGGHFVQNNLAIVGELGYNAIHSSGYNTNDWNYAAGVKYYVDKVLPIQVDWNGSTGNFSNPTKSNLGFSLGYAVFPNKQISVEPTLKYNVSLNNNYKNTFSGGVGVNYFFK